MPCPTRLSIASLLLQPPPLPAAQVRFNRARRGTLRVGDVAPDITLHDIDGQAVTIHQARTKGRPLVILAGSYS